MAFRSIQKFFCEHLLKRVQINKPVPKSPLQSFRAKGPSTNKQRSRRKSISSPPTTSSIVRSSSLIPSYSNGFSSKSRNFLRNICTNFYSNFSTLFLFDSSPFYNTNIITRCQHNAAIESNIQSVNPLKFYTRTNKEAIETLQNQRIKRRSVELRQNSTVIDEFLRYKTTLKLPIETNTIKKFQDISITSNGTRHQFVFDKKPPTMFSVKDNLLDINLMRKFNINFIKARKQQQLQQKNKSREQNFPKYDMPLKRKSEMKKNQRNENSSKQTTPVVVNSNPKQYLPSISRLQNTLPAIGDIRPGIPLQSSNKTFTTTSMKSLNYKPIKSILNQITILTNKKNERRFISHTTKYPNSEPKGGGDFSTDEGFKFKPIIPQRFVPIEKKQTLKKKIFVPGSSKQNGKAMKI